MFVRKMTPSQSSLYGEIDDLQDLTFIERPIRRSLKVCITNNVLSHFSSLCSSLFCLGDMVQYLRIISQRVMLCLKVRQIVWENEKLNSLKQKMIYLRALLFFLKLL